MLLDFFKPIIPTILKWMISKVTESVFAGLNPLSIANNCKSVANLLQKSWVYNQMAKLLQKLIQNIIFAIVCNRELFKWMPKLVQKLLQSQIVANRWHSVILNHCITVNEILAVIAELLQTDCYLSHLYSCEDVNPLRMLTSFEIFIWSTVSWCIYLLDALLVVNGTDVLVVEVLACCSAITRLQLNESSPCDVEQKIPPKVGGSSSKRASSHRDVYFAFSLH